MGGEGSGRKPDPLKQFFPQNKGKPTGMSFEPKTEIASDIYAPNYGAVKGARIKDFTDKLDDIYVNVSGDTMTGNLCMAGNSLFFDADCDSGFASTVDNRINIGIDGATKGYIDTDELRLLTLDIGMQGSNLIEFRDSDITINSATDGHLDLTSDVSIDLNSPLVVMSSATLDMDNCTIDLDYTNEYSGTGIVDINLADMKANITALFKYTADVQDTAGSNLAMITNAEIKNSMAGSSVNVYGERFTMVNGAAQSGGTRNHRLLYPLSWDWGQATSGTENRTGVYIENAKNVLGIVDSNTSNWTGVKFTGTGTFSKIAGSGNVTVKGIDIDAPTFSSNSTSGDMNAYGIYSGDWDVTNADNAYFIYSEGGDVRLADTLFFEGENTGVPFGEIKAVNNSTETTISSAGTAVQVTIFDTNGLSNDTTPDHTNDHITILKAGKYMVNISATINSVAGAASKFEFSCQKNNGASEIIPHMDRNIAGGTGSAGVISLSGIADLAVNDTVECWIENETNTQNYVVEDISLALFQLGGT